MNGQKNSRKTIWSWALYDFANSSFTTLTVTFIYATYFTLGIAENETEGTRQWSTAIAITAFVVAVLSPYLGALADRGGLRKHFLATSTIICVAGSILLFFPQEGQVRFALAVFVITNIAFEMGNVFYNAYLPDIAPAEQIGRISGYGWGLGYVGGLLCLVAALFGFVQTDTPILGFGTDNGENIRATNLLVAVWFALFSLPIFFLVKNKSHQPVPDVRTLIGQANQQLVSTFLDISRRFRQVLRFLVARLVYNDGLITVFAFGGIYASTTFGFSTEKVIVFGITLNIAAGLGALAFGYIDDKLGGRTTIILSLVGLIGFGLTAVLARMEILFWIAGLGAGLLAGPNQSASRSLLGRFTPEGKRNEFYGFFALSGKFTAFLGPLLLGLVVQATGSQRWGMATVIFFFAAGLILLLRVNEKDGIRNVLELEE
ncbi:MAG: MFS transporter [Rhodothermaceae bacterium]|nr:MFS transporter [Rhodothermaceae bacterium]